MEGKQCAVVNEMNRRTGFYQLLGVEAEVRNLSRKYLNSYHFVIFACCRETFDGRKA